MRPKESSHGKLPLVLNITRDWESILSEQAIKLPFRHHLIVASRVPWVVQRHLKVAAPAAPLSARCLPVAARCPRHRFHFSSTT
ncbi:hypothetical protein CsatA_019880 [Cannabis sativa]